MIISDVPKRAVNLIGQKFGRLTVDSFAEMRGKHSYWNCTCDCGEYRCLPSTSLRTGHSKSCGCLNRETIASNVLDLSGKKFGTLTAIKILSMHKKNGSLWLCQCECGNAITVYGSSLKRGERKHCGCGKFDQRKDISGQVFGRLRVISFSDRREYGTIGRTKTMWKCRCKCGKEVEVAADSLSVGKTRSCGCLVADAIREATCTHKMSDTRTYRIWLNMKDRCCRELNPAYKHYGGRGICVCDRWLNSFENFLKDMGECPSDEYSIDRFPDNNGNYEPDNCRWATKIQQANNTRANVKLEYRGEEKTLAEWCVILEIPYYVARTRIQVKKWPIEVAFETPFRKSFRRRDSVDV